MNITLFAAGILSIIVGLVHSILGEFLIFKKLRDGTVIPTMATAPLREKNIRILWATWHIASFFGWALGAMLIKISISGFSDSAIIVQYTGVAMFLAGILVLISTKARHPGWVGLCGVAILCWLA
jgi:hypothetical protein